MKISTRDVVMVLFRHKSKVMTFFVVAVILATVGIFLAPDSYRSQAKLLIRLGRENLSVDPSVSGPTVTAYRDRESEVNSELAILLSRHLIEQVVDTMGEDALLPSEGSESSGVRPVKAALRMAKGVVKGALTSVGIMAPMTPREKAIKSIAKQLSAQVEKRTSVITASLDAASPEQAQKTLDALIRLYLEQHIKVYAAQASPEFFESQADQLRNAVLQSEQALSKFRAENGIANMDQQKQVLLGQISDLEKQLADAATQAGAAEARVTALNTAIKNLPKTRELSRTTGRTNYAADSIKTKLTELRLKESDLAARYASDHRPLVEVREQIQQMEGALAQEEETLTEITTGIDTNVQELQLNLETQQAECQAQQKRKAVLEQELTSLRDRLTTLVGQEADLAMLEKDVQVADAAYVQYRDNVQRAKVSAALDFDNVSNVSVIQPATWPEVPVRPNKAASLGLGIALAALASLLLAFAFEYLSDYINSKDDVESHLGVPVLLTVSEKEFKQCT